MIAILCPSRGRPEKFNRFYQSAVKTGANFKIYCYLDESDPTKDKYPEDSKHLEVIIGPDRRLAQAYQFLYEMTKEPVIMLGADDLVFTAGGWDNITLPVDQRWLISYDDGGFPKKEDGHPFISRKFIDDIGYLTHPRFEHALIDNWLAEISKAIGVYHYHNLKIEHVHPKYGKDTWDDTYKRRTPEMGNTAKKAWHDLRDERREIVRRLSTDPA